MIYYLVYKLTNLVNGKIYVGCHVTKDVNDGYMGSGRRLNYAKKKYGVENFKKEILKVCETADEMLAEEKKIVDEEFLKRSDVYNLTCGGRGSWFWINKNRTPDYRKYLGSIGGFANASPETRRKAGLLGGFSQKEVQARIKRCDWNGRKHKDQTKVKMSASHLNKHNGPKNSQWGTKWINLEGVTKKVKKEELQKHLLLGWKLGR